ncbi:MAG TPA: TetR/AcrR family transcriptional regulator [Actinophytocola sp.]|uniref:TetR/AcrR family transcriptional regulator n=1 Tax=Actinophytocola sp. TaxID=1872138 RepID=UPI002DBAF7AB|nr:TetR/AcrR family transcriptional regulator [Actinophytocola sp.]HEU5471430.1 TetR/AcrR family transcriptional regulator [Actinophytocola sp.]
MGAEMPGKKDEAAETLARSVEVLWGHPDRPTRGPKPGMSVDRIVQAAIDLADTEGMAAVSMQRVASEFGFTTMSLYRYVPGKSELIDLMVDSVLGDPPDLTAIPGGWRPRLAAWARLTMDCFLRHPWFLPEALQRMMGPRQISWLECAVAALAESGLTGEELLGSVLIVNGYVRSMVPFATAPPTPDQDRGTLLIRLITDNAPRYPALTSAIADGAFSPSQHDDIEFGLQRVLDGIQTYIDSRAPN